ncbi:hypothetical protein GON03_15265 [Nocardioides sp. MAH-18]|uniref:DUF975 family protein n=1 Tax=Nocardioides agri TaxID=2682843 RepID=A0A6L6XYL5_9ACTN|nr:MULTISPECIES: hypothetical protein [unclassified Nocardioides]MBA2955695.1 hypothetical protein [Nocardioides sp. CGMCC 1.13656]MVQ50545.1 hypothetical protein [Nocardioides sp. MAH-18]
MSENLPPPPPPEPSMYPPAGGQAWSLGEALSYGWKKFQENASQILLAVVVLFVVALVTGFIAWAFQALMTTDPTCTVTSEGFDCDEGSGTLWRMIVGGIAAAFQYFVMLVVGAGILRGALGITDGRPFQTAEIFKTDQIGGIIVASLVVGLATGIGYVLFILPGVVIAFLTSYTLLFVIDQNLPPIDAIRASFDLTTKHLGNTVVWYVVGGLVAIAGAIACGVGLLVTIPLVIIGTAYTYKVLTAQPVAA